MSAPRPVTTTISHVLCPFPLTDENSRPLGVGERLGPGVYCRTAISTHPDRWFALQPSDEGYGEEVTADDERLFRTPLIGHDTYHTGAIRSAEAGKGRFDLVPFEAVQSLARRLEYGVAQGYPERNWEKGMPLSRILSSMRRHSMQVGYDFTEDHLGAVLFGAAAFTAIAARIEAGLLPKELDDIGWFLRRGEWKGAA
jgi:hypothetical protein